jgi:CRISPR-associated endoribonuclease Cas6
VSSEVSSHVARRLAAPARRLSLATLTESWFEARIVARIAGHGALAHDLRLLRRIRGGIGGVLMEAASPDALAGRPCPWNPPCALDILFREQGRSGAHGIPKPYVLAADRRGQDLLLSMTLFGFAADWASVASHALAATIQHRIDWRGQRPEFFMPPRLECDIVITSVDSLPLPSLRSTVEIELMTPMSAEGDEPLERPATFFARLARRVEGLALWQDAAIDEDWQFLGKAWNALSYDTRDLRRTTAERRSGKAREDFTTETVEGTLRISDMTPELWPLLVLGRSTHVGKGASEGFGRYLLA